MVAREIELFLNNQLKNKEFLKNTANNEHSLLWKTTIVTNYG